MVSALACTVSELGFRGKDHFRQEEYGLQGMESDGCIYFGTSNCSDHTKLFVG